MESSFDREQSRSSAVSQPRNTQGNRLCSSPVASDSRDFPSIISQIDSPFCWWLYISGSRGRVVVCLSRGRRVAS